MASVAKRRWKKPGGATGEAWAVRYFDEKGVRRSKTFDQKKAADAFKRQVEREIEDGTHVASASSRTISLVGEEFIKHYEDRYRNGVVGRSRLTSIRRDITKHIIPSVGSTLIASMSFSDVERARSSLVSAKLSPIYIKQILYLFKQMEDFARLRGYTKRSVVHDVIREAPGAKAARVRVPSAEEVRKLFDAAAIRAVGRSERTRALLQLVVTIAAFAGLRYGEIMALRPDTVLLEGADPSLLVRASVTRWGTIKAPKTKAGVRNVPLASVLVDMLQDWMNKHYIKTDEELLFTTRNGQSITNTGFHTSYWRPLLRRAGLADEGDARLHFHALRHFAGSMMVEHGLPLPDVASVLGHEHFDVTLQVYVHPIVGGRRRAAAMESMARSPLLLPSDAGLTHSVVSI